MTKLLLNEAAYRTVLLEEVPQARRFVWIATADIKDLHVEKTKGRFVPFLEVLADLVDCGVEIRLIHAKEPGPRFRKDFDRYPVLIHSDRFERVLCPRMHAKMIIIDGKRAYLGSANLTGAGIGSKAANRRNFEAGVFTSDPEMLGELIEFFDSFWIGDSCPHCAHRDRCPEPIC